MHMKILFISPQLPRTRRNAVADKSRRVLSLLCQNYDVDLACPLQQGESSYAHNACEGLGLGELIFRSVDAQLKPSRTDDRRGYGQDGVSPGVSRSLKSELESRCHHYDMIICDHFLSLFYLPEEFQGKTAYHAHAVRVIHNPRRGLAGMFGSLVNDGVRQREVEACERVDLVFAESADAVALADAGIPFGKLKYCLTQLNRNTPKSPEFNATQNKLGYVGYLGDNRNVSSLLWLINSVLPLVMERHPDVELHLIGKDPDIRLLNLAMQRDNIFINTSHTSPDITPAGCRVAVDPLLFEDHVDAKLVNALVRRIPTVTTCIALDRAGQASGGMLAASGAREMSDQIISLLSDKTLWSAVRETSNRSAAERVPVQEVFYAMKRAIADSSQMAVA
jgi:hypothetical protein